MLNQTNNTTNRRIKAALIDMDGTLYDSMPHHADAWMHLMNDLDIPASREEFFLLEGATGGHTIDLKIRQAKGRPATPEEQKEYYAIKSKYFASMGEVSLIPGATDLVKALQERGIITVLVTGSGQKTLLERLEHDFPGAFPAERRVTSASVTHGKPAPDPFLKGLELAGVDASCAIAIDNAPLGTTSAVAAGILTAGVITGPIPADNIIKTGAHLVYNSMTECAEMLPRLLDMIESCGLNPANQTN